MSLFISSVFTYDEDAGNYIQAVEGASGDNQALEPATRKAINNFVIGCKQDGIWTAIKASCILAGARTLAGALQPLVGTAPTNVGGLFVSGDYTRKTGLIGNGSTKYLNSNRNNNADPQNSNHNAIYVTTAGASISLYMGAGPLTSETGANNFGRDSASTLFFRNRTSSAFTFSGVGSNVGLIGTNREASSQYQARAGGSTATVTATSQTPFSGSVFIFATGGSALFGTQRMTFYSIGESLDLARLDARVTDLINAFAVTIP